MLYRRSEQHPSRALEVREDDHAVIRRGTIATDTPLRYRFRDIGPGMLQLAITDELLAEWRRQGITRVPLVRNHGLNAEGGFFAAPNPEQDLYGNLEAFAIEKVGGRCELAADFRFTFALTPSDMLQAARTAPYLPTSVGFAFEDADLTILPEKHRNGLPIVRAERWRIAEGSVTVVGLDPATHIRSYTMSDRTDNREESMGGRAIHLSVDQFDRLLARVAPQPEARSNNAGDASDNGMSENALDQLAERVVARLEARAQSSAPAAAAAPEAPTAEAGEEPDSWEVLSDRATDELGAEKALELLRASNGSLAAYRSAIKLALATKESATPPTEVSGGADGAARAMETFVAATLARGLNEPKAKAHWTERANELDRGWRDRGIVRTCRDILLATGDSYNHDQVYRQMDPVTVIETAKHVSSRCAEQRSIEFHGAGMMYYRTASGGLVPANLPAAFQDILRLAVQSGYQRYLLPMDRLAVREDTATYRKEKIVDVDAALEFRPLETQEQFLPIQLREGESTIKAEPYGHRYLVSEEALVNDDRRVLVGLPQLFGQLYAEGKNRAFVVALSKTSNFPDDNQRISKNPLDYSADVLTAIARARQKRPVAAPAGEEVGLTSGKSQVLTPTAAVWGELAFNQWFARTRELGVGDGIGDRADSTVHEPLIRLRSNGHMDLNLAANLGILWPGPESMFCPMAFGGVAGRTGIRTVATSLMDTGERDALRYTISTTFYAKALENRKQHMFQLTDQSLPASA